METENKGNKTPEECKELHGFFCKRVEEIRPGLKDNFNEWGIASKDPDVLMMYEIIVEYVELARTQERDKLIREIGDTHEVILNRLRTALLSKDVDLGLDYDYGLKTAIGIIKVVQQQFKADNSKKEKGE